MSKLKWLTPKGIYAHYLNDATTRDGTPVVDIIGQCRKQLAFEAEVFEMTGSKESDRPEYERHIKPLQATIREAMDSVHMLMMSQAECGRWIGFGRRHPDSEEEIIPTRYWPFLTLDIESRAAKGDEVTFRAVRGLITDQIPEGHGILDRIREAQKIPGDTPASTATPEPVAQPVPALPATGTPGRPSSMHLIRPEFERRVAAGTLEPSLNRESEALVAWLMAAHPDMPPPTPKTVANNLRKAYRDAENSR